MRQPLTEREREEALEAFGRDTGLILSGKQQGFDRLTKYLAELLPPALIEVLQNSVDLVYLYSMDESGVTFDGRSDRLVKKFLFQSTRPVRGET